MIATARNVALVKRGASFQVRANTRAILATVGLRTRVTIAASAIVRFGRCGAQSAYVIATARNVALIECGADHSSALVVGIQTAIDRRLGTTTHVDAAIDKRLVAAIRLDAAIDKRWGDSRVDAAIDKRLVAIGVDAAIDKRLIAIGIGVRIASALASSAS